ncbi:MAG: hypothetical protein ABEI80_05245 [Haloplanus sp.]
MELTRRALLGTGAAVGFTGCLSAGRSNVAYPETSTATPTETAADAALVDAETEPAATDGDGAKQAEPSVPNRRLASEVERIYGELEWFATAYDESIRTYRRTLGKAMAAVQRVRKQASFDASSLRVVRRATTHAVTVAERELGGHFGIPSQMRDQIDAHLSTIERFADRGDLDRVDEELARLHDYLQGIRSDLFVRRVLSDRQIDTDLYRTLHDGTPDDEGDDEDEAPPGLFELYHSSGYATYAYDGPRYIEREPFGDDDAADENEGEELLARQRVQFDAAGEATGRTGFAYVVSYAVPDESNQPADLEPLEYPHASLFVQRYADASAAGAAVDTLFETSLNQEGRFSFGRERWQQVYYDAGGDVMYAFLIQAGPFVLLTAPSEVAWEERINWTAGLDRIWFWDR